jgi:GntR family transcriptional repressor for pyruvate dehydrogenase complex
LTIEVKRRVASEGEIASSRIFSPIKVHRTFEAVIERIVDAIDAQGLKDGDRLPNESEMAKMLDVSRPTLRQALRILENSGVLRIRAGQAGGVFVASEMIPVDVLGRNIAHEVDHAAELIATRRLLEPIVYHLAADNASEEAISRIADTIVLMGKHINDPRMIQRADGMFHRRVAHAAGNQILLRTMGGIYRELNPLRGALNNDAEHGRHMIDVHTRLLNAMRARDHDLLDQVLEETFVDLEAEFKVKSRFATRLIALPWTSKRPA